MNPTEIRKAQDKDMIMNPNRWPDVKLYLKTQPWVTDRNVGFMYEGDLTVYVGPGPNFVLEYFSSIDQLVDRWSVD